MDFNNYKFPCSEVINIVTEPRSNSLPTAKQVEKALDVLAKENFLELCKTDVDNLLIVIDKHAKYSKTKMSAREILYLSEIYAEEVFGISRIVLFDEKSKRPYQVNGTKNEKIAIDILERIDGVRYEKNKKYFENDIVIGKPDIVHNGLIREIKTFANYADFLRVFNSKPKTDSIVQHNCYMEISGCDYGEIICVATGVHPEEIEKYEVFAKEYYLRAGVNKDIAERRVKQLVSDMDLSKIPDQQRVKRFPIKKNKELIRKVGRGVTRARGWLQNLHEKLNKLVALPEDFGKKQ